MKKSQQLNLKLFLLLILFLAVSMFCALTFINRHSSNIKVFASTTSQTEEVSEEIDSLSDIQTEIAITSVTAQNREYDGTANVRLVVEISGVAEGDDASVTATGTMVDANVGNKKYVEVSNFKIVGENKDKYCLPATINISPVYVDISQKYVSLIWNSTSLPDRFVYTGEDQISNINCYYINILGRKVDVNFSISGYQVFNSKTYNYSGTFLNSGNYKATAIPAATDANYNLIDFSGDREMSFLMSRAKSQINLSDTTFTYNGSLQDASRCASLNNDEQTLSFANNTFTTVEEGNNLVVEVSAPQSLNYMLLSTTYTINVLKATGTIDVSNVTKDFVYTGTERSITSGATIDNTEQTLVYYNNTFTTVSQANGRIVTVFAPESANYNYVSTDFEISMQKATINTSGWRWSASSFVYNGKMQTMTVLNYDSSLVTASYNGATNTEAGKYLASVVFVLKDSQNYNPVTFESKEWEIKRAIITIPNVSDVVSTYSGEVQYACSLNSIYYTVSNNAQINAGSYVVSIKLNSSSNTIWANGSEEDITFNWTIEKAKVATPHVSQKFVYNGKTQTLDVEESDKYTILNQTASEVGEHYCHLVLNDSTNYEWQDNANSPVLTLTWIITSSENYDESTPMVAVVITCILIILVCVYITLQFTVVKKRRSRKPSKQKVENINSQNQSALASKQENEEKPQTEQKQAEVALTDNEKSPDASSQQPKEDLNEQILTEVKPQHTVENAEEVQEVEAEEIAPEEGSSQDKARKKRMLSRKKEDKKKRKKLPLKPTEPKKRGRPPKKQVATRGRPRRNVSKTAPKTASRTKSLKNAK